MQIKEEKIKVDPLGREKTPPMLRNQVSRLCMSAAQRAHGDDGSHVQHSCRIILMRLARQDGSTQSELAAAGKMSAPSISAVLRTMESDGLVERRSDPEDQRVTRVYLTEAGRAAEEKNYQVIRHVDSIAMDGISSSDQEAFCRILLKMRDNLIKELEGKNEAEEIS
jgi:DNA-binding MarR family transcriptional regulator